MRYVPHFSPAQLRKLKIPYTMTFMRYHWMRYDNFDCILQVRSRLFSSVDGQVYIVFPIGDT